VRTARARRLAVAVIAMAALGTAPAGASGLEIELDPARTQVRFSLGATLHTVHGSLRLVSGTLSVDPATGLADGEIVADASSAETGNHKRDQKMHADVLRSAAHPRIVLRPLRLAGELRPEGTSELTLVTELELVGARHELRLPLAVEVSAGTFTTRAEFTVPYVSWGLGDPSTFVLRVAKEVVVVVEASGTLRWNEVVAPP
jgi:polyisoprenoid-binding protein YceI